MLQLAGSAANTINSRFMKYYDNASLLYQQILSTPDSIFKSSIGLSTKKNRIQKRSFGKNHRWKSKFMNITRNDR